MTGRVLSRYKQNKLTQFSGKSARIQGEKRASFRGKEYIAELYRRVLDVFTRHEELMRNHSPDKIKAMRDKTLKGMKASFGKTSKDDAIVKRFAENAAKPHVESAKEKRVGHHQAPMMQGCVPLNKLFEKGTNNLFVMRQELVQRRVANRNDKANSTIGGQHHQQQEHQTVAEIQAAVATMKIKAVKAAIKADEFARYKKNFPEADMRGFDDKYFKPLFTDITDYEHEFAQL